jgi:hypothetical protein
VGLKVAYGLKVGRSFCMMGLEVAWCDGWT